MRHTIKWYKPGKKITVNDKMQTNYEYILSKPYGQMTDYPDFNPYFTPQEMLSMGIFEGKYINDGINEFPKEWYSLASLSLNDKADVKYNYFKVKSRQSLQEWKKKGWIMGPDVRGWFQWYCRFYIGRRIPLIDEKQISRWKAFRRHRGAIEKHCDNNIKCRPKQRQALLQWSHYPF